ncbi:FAD-dependent monooxygenase [Nocardia arthritidis]|uniref:FAD-dependent oxidoreductase n=1 Tax=Nocardia arthritidis TaxID=228602 RepID=A0A6G9YP72_9NOCA|nr:FAD-dependent monooxygenase [Nocardia arthritidis]QIS14998.1 FAD-dependent oxidoreductase [Nocardia arthritidis]
MSSNRNVLISGASIAGPALAYWLNRNGFRTTIVELAPALRPGGNGVDLRGDAVRLVAQTGILPELRELATDIRALTFVDERGAQVATMPNSAFNTADDIEIMRGDLARKLHEITSDETEYRFGTTIEALTQRPDGVAVTFADGTTEIFDLVIGADGLHSRVRNLAIIPEARAVHHLGLYFATAQVDSSFGAPGTVTLYNIPGKVAGVYRSAAHDTAGAFFMLREPHVLEFDHRDRDAQKALLRKYFDIPGWRVRELLAQATADESFYFDAADQIRIPHWSSGRVALVGDAGYCATLLSGAGASLALTGAHLLATELAAAAGDHRRAFDRYEATLRPTVAKHQRATKLSSALLIPAGPSQLWLRNRLARILTFEPVAAKVFRQQFERAA